MNLKLLIDGVVRQSTVFLAQLSTASGVRSPLSHVADQVFLELARELEGQGVRRQVVADMFGMALRSYTKKVNRLTESASVRDRTLWEAVLDFVGEGEPSRARILSRFSADGEREVAAVLKDLVRSGLVYVTGSGRDCVYGVTSPEVREAVKSTNDVDTLAHLAWLEVFRGRAHTRAALGANLDVDAELLGRALEELFATGRLQELDGRLVAANFVVSFGSEQGWETAVLDHFRTVTTAIAKKVRMGASNAAPNEEVGGSTFTFNVFPGHPHEKRVRGLLSELRQSVQVLWDEVARYNEAHQGGPERTMQVSFYVGQTLEDEEDDAEN